MYATLADITIVYTAVFGEPQPGDMPYVKAGELVRAARRDDWQDIFTTAMSERLRNPGLSYARIAGIVKQLHNLG